MTVSETAQTQADGAQSSTESPFLSYLRSVCDKKIFFDPLRGNHGDRVIRLGAEHVLRKARSTLADSPKSADIILINGGFSISDVWKTGVPILKRYRRENPNKPVVVAPASFLFRETDFAAVCKESDAPLKLFVRERPSVEHLRGLGLPVHVELELSDDLAFELRDSDFIAGLKRKLSGRHVLISMRRDREGVAGVLGKTRAPWLPRPIRRPLSWLRDRLVASRSGDVIEQVLKREKIPEDLPRRYGDLSMVESFDEFVSAIVGARLVVTDRLHVGVLAHLLDKPVVLKRGTNHKIPGVYGFSMSGPGSRTTLWQ